MVVLGGGRCLMGEVPHSDFNEFSLFLELETFDPKPFTSYNPCLDLFRPPGISLMNFSSALIFPGFVVSEIGPAVVPTNPRDKIKSTNLRSQIHLDNLLPKGWLSR